MSGRPFSRSGLVNTKTAAGEGSTPSLPHTCPPSQSPQSPEAPSLDPAASSCPPQVVGPNAVSPCPTENTHTPRAAVSTRLRCTQGQLLLPTLGPQPVYLLAAQSLLPRAMPVLLSSCLLAPAQARPTPSSSLRPLWCRPAVWTLQQHRRQELRGKGGCCFSLPSRHGPSCGTQGPCPRAKLPRSSSPAWPARPHTWALPPRPSAQPLSPLPGPLSPLQGAEPVVGASLPPGPCCCCRLARSLEVTGEVEQPAPPSPSEAQGSAGLSQPGASSCVDLGFPCSLSASLGVPVPPHRPPDLWGREFGVPAPRAQGPVSRPSTANLGQAHHQRLPPWPLPDTGRGRRPGWRWAGVLLEAHRNKSSEQGQAGGGGQGGRGPGHWQPHLGAPLKPFLLGVGSGGPEAWAGDTGREGSCWKPGRWHGGSPGPGNRQGGGRRRMRLGRSRSCRHSLLTPRCWCTASGHVGAPAAPRGAHVSDRGPSPQRPALSSR